jgi:hypothetical protein
MQARDYFFMNICGRSPRRARNTIVLCGDDLLGEAQPQ